MAPRARRSARLGRTFSLLRSAAEGDLGRAMAARAAIVSELDRLETALAAETRFADLVVVPGLARIAALAARLRAQDRAIAGLRQRRADLMLAEKRLEARAETRRREADRRQDRKDLVALTDAAAGRQPDSFPQGEER